MINDVNGSAWLFELVDFRGTWRNSEKRDMVGIVVDSRLASSGKANLKYGFILQFFQACINMTTQGVGITRSAACGIREHGDDNDDACVHGFHV